ncbi:MAG TPA: AMP-binding protein, partial [Treponemataceae bacterium]|nr:AMP-binding protein [Treponemataceae bacterium]
PYAIGYGLTETSPLLAGSGPSITKVGTVGPVMPGVEMKLVDIDSATGVGEVTVRGLNVMKGYYRDEEMTRAVLDQEGWFRTGDLGTIDKTGRLALKGRSKNMILGATGENIYPEDIEFVLNQHPFVSESLVVEGENSSLVAYVQIDEEKLAKIAAEKAAQEAPQGAIQSMTEAMGEAVTGAMNDMQYAINYKREEIINEIKFFVNENVNRMSRIDRIEAVHQFEKTASQKIKRYLYTISKSMSGHGGKS